jgi:diaminopimelate epimerase
MARPKGQHFYKMTGSGNDFVVFDAANGAAERLENTETIKALSARGTGVGSDGVVFLETAGQGDIRMRYYNADGSEASLCGNASLCSTRLAVELGLAQAGGFILHTAAGSLRARIRDNLPEVDLDPVTDVHPDASDLGIKKGERRPATRCGVSRAVEVPKSTRQTCQAGVRSQISIPTDGANVNFVAQRHDGSFTYRTERGVEAADGVWDGAVATAIMLSTGES